jgi:hypothetical protein
MFIAALIIAIAAGYIFKGKLANIDVDKIKAIYLVIASFVIEAIIIFSMRNGYLSRGWLTFILDLIMYMLLFLFVYLNRKDKWIVLIGIGFLLNAVPIFLNGGAMPVSASALSLIGYTGDVNTHGLYKIIDSTTIVPFLGDVIYIKYPTPNAASIGDFIECLGIALFVVTGMTNKAKVKGTVNN